MAGGGGGRGLGPRVRAACLLPCSACHLCTLTYTHTLSLSRENIVEVAPSTSMKRRPTVSACFGFGILADSAYAAFDVRRAGVTTACEN